MNKLFYSFKRIPIFVAFIVLITGLIIPLFSNSKVKAVGLITSRNIEMSDSNISDTNVTYQIGFTTATTATVQDIIVDFCSNLPIPGETCTAPTGFTVGTPTVATAGGANTGLSGTWTAESQNSGRTLEIFNNTGGSISSGTSIIFTLSTATNPSTLGTFYGRILTFDTEVHGDAYSATSLTNVIDAGGVALSTVSQLTITAKVQEQLTFCIDTNSAANCGAASGTSVLLGDTQDVLSTTGPYVDKSAQYITQTNATGGAAIRMKGTTLTSGANTIAATGAGATSSPGTSQFGMCTYELSGTDLSIISAYNGGAANVCKNTSQTAGTGSTGGDNGATFSFQAATTGTFGDQISTESSGSQSIGTLVWLGNVSTTQTAGIYTTILTFIATGTY